ncbi:MAG: hypothetical protein IJF65_00770, partial [Clostridia bacterium]|nr:hypothetical protein [Clostridia bacterium]
LRMTHRLPGKSSTRKEVRKWQLLLRELGCRGSSPALPLHPEATGTKQTRPFGNWVQGLPCRPCVSS